MIDEKLTQLLAQAEFHKLHIPKHQLVVDATTQALHTYLSEDFATRYTISTSKYGLGEEVDSLKTPRGLHSIADRIGSDVVPGTRFESRQPFGTVVTDWASEDAEDDAILSRILRLKGMTVGLNAGPGIDSYERMVYIHGTNHEQDLGVPASHGCIRMGNHDLVELYDWLGDNPALVWIG